MMYRTPNPSNMLTAMRRAQPLVHCITNFVAMNTATNVLLAAGASPAMIDALALPCRTMKLTGEVEMNHDGGIL